MKLRKAEGGGKPGGRFASGPSGVSAFHRHHAAFTLLEVIIALTIFFMAIFAILGSVSRSLGAARSLQQKFPDIGSLAADLMLTNKLEEGTVDGDFGDLHPGYTWRRDIYLKATNGFFQVDFTIRSPKGRQQVVWKNSILLWRPDSQVSTFGRRL